MKRCDWQNIETSQLYIDYHDNEWGKASFDDDYLFEMIVLESFQCGLSWLTILKKRNAFRIAFDEFNPNIIANYNQEKIDLLCKNADIIRNKLKIKATIENAKSFLKIQNEFGSFRNYIWSFTNNEIVFSPYNKEITHNELSDKVSQDLKKRGFKFMGTVVTFSYLEAIGVMNNHAEYCFKYKNQN